MAFVRSQVLSGRSHADISRDLQAQNPGTRGLSERSVRRFCHVHDLHYRCGLSQQELDGEVQMRVAQVTAVNPYCVDVHAVIHASFK